MKSIIGIILLLGIMGDSCERDNYRGTKTITGKVVEKHQVSRTFSFQCQIDGAHAIIDTPTERYDIVGNETATTILGDSIYATIKDYVMCDANQWVVTELRIVK